MNRAFSLIQISILITIVSLTLVACLPSLNMSPKANADTAVKMNGILSALRRFEAANGRLPCPADASQPTGGALYGVEAAGGGASGDCTGGSPAANNSDSASHVATGMLPVRTLGLSADYALDAWGRSFTYAVDTNATSCFQGTLAGGITVTDNGIAQPAVAVLVSHGGNGHGAWLPQAGATGTAVRLNSGSQNADELTNAHVDVNFNPVTPLSQFVRKAPAAGFDDLVAYHNPGWSLATQAVAASVTLAQLTPPSSNTYIPGETLTFSLTYAAAVTVTGAPRLELTIGSITRYAGYVSGSGSTTLSFTYTLQTSDYAPGGIAVTSPVNLNGGTISAACNGFVVPSLAGVAVKKLYLYVSDYNNNRVESFDAMGNYLLQFGSSGILAGLFTHPDQLAVDANNNVWVTDWGNSRVQEFSAGGSYESKFGSTGVLNGQFINPGFIAFDSGGNSWVSDTGNSRVEEFSAAGIYQSQFGSAGILNGQFLAPGGIAFDASGNLWIGDFGNDRLEKFSAAGAYLGKFGTLGSGNGQLAGPCGHALDASGNIWVVDSGNNRVEKFDANGNYLSKFGTPGNGNGQFSTPCGIAIDVAGNLWVADGGNNRVQEFNSTGGYLSQFGSLGIGNGQFWTPAGLALLYQ